MWISIHAPLTGSDRSLSTMPPSERNFNPRSPYGERLLSTNSANTITDNFNPRSPYGERHYVHFSVCGKMYISIHAPLTGSDLHTSHHPCWDAKFQSTLPLRGATVRERSPCLPCSISIHAPLTGSDVYVISCIGGVDDFNPRSPYGERPPSGR